MKKQRIVLASILKPVNDTRMYEKMAVSLHNSGDYEVVVVGFSAPIRPGDNIKQIGIGKFRRTSPSRLIAPIKVLWTLINAKPDILIINTHELLMVGLISRILLGSKLVYDIQENYYRNIIYGESFPRLFRWPLALWVRLKEKISAPFIGHFLLAEKGYQNEMNFFGRRFSVVENKCLLPAGFQRNPDPKHTVLLFSGTLAKSTGIFEAIGLAKELHNIDTAIRLTIVGYCAINRTLEEIKESIEGHPWIKLIGGGELVPHAEIFNQISLAHFGIISYPPSPHIANSIPTKLYEYLACRLPVLLYGSQKWMDICRPFNAAVEVDFSAKPQEILHLMSGEFYQTTPGDVTWDEEGKNLIGIMSALTS